MKKNQYILILVALLISGASFFAGTRYQSNRKGNLAAFSASRDMDQGQRGQQVGQQANVRMGQANPQGGAIINGEIISKDGQSLTLKMSDGGAKIVIVADSTLYKKSIDAVVADLTMGENVTIIGTNNTDGSVTAKTVTIGETTIPR